MAVCWWSSDSNLRRGRLRNVGFCPRAKPLELTLFHTTRLTHLRGNIAKIQGFSQMLFFFSSNRECIRYFVEKKLLLMYDCKWSMDCKHDCLYVKKKINSYIANKLLNLEYVQHITTQQQQYNNLDKMKKKSVKWLHPRYEKFLIWNLKISPEQFPV